MSHLVFFSYARENLDPYLEDFFKDLCAEIAPLTQWGPEDENISFRDKNNLRLMEYWKTDIEGALQSSSVLVGITSVAYFNKEFCGREYYVFDQRRRQGVPQGSDPPPVILPVIWAPVSGGVPAYMNAQQQVPKGIADTYRNQGLRRLMRFEPAIYNQCVTAFADAIVDAWRNYKIKPLPNVKDFHEIPNQFASGDWQEAADPSGWIPGPEVANFVFAAGSAQEFPQPVGRYGAKASEWRPYLPPEPDMIIDHAKKAAQSFKFRELPVGKDLEEELKAAKDRKNLTLLLADLKCLTSLSFAQVSALEKVWWEGTALILPFDDPVLKWEDDNLRKVFSNAFPVISQLQTPNVKAPIRSGTELRLALEMTLADLRSAVTRAETGKKEKSDEPPPGVTAVPGAKN
jgi:hypothetical protein